LVDLFQPTTVVIRTSYDGKCATDVKLDGLTLYINKVQLVVTNKLMVELCYPDLVKEDFNLFPPTVG
jgi:hypothetical protein